LLPPSIELPLHGAADGVRVAVRLTPRGGVDRIEGITCRADGQAALKVSVTAAPIEGRANQALLQLLSKEWRLARRDLTIVAGGKSRDKIVQIATGDPDGLMRRLGAALTAGAGVVESGGG
jgi:uncharacterized protein